MATSNVPVSKEVGYSGTISIEGMPWALQVADGGEDPGIRGLRRGLFAGIVVRLLIAGRTHFIEDIPHETHNYSERASG